MTSRYVLYDTYSEPCLLLKIQTYSGIFTFRYIQPYCGIFRNQDILYIQNSVKAYSGIFRTLCDARILKTLPYSEFWHIGNPRYIRNFVYLGTFRLTFNNDSYNNVNFLFFALMLKTFRRNLKILCFFFDYNDVSFNARLSLLK